VLGLTLGFLQVSPALAQAPVNDDFDNAIVVPGLPFTDAQDTSETTTAADDPLPSCVGTTHTVWYRFTPPADMPIAANTFGSDYDTTLSVWTGTRGALEEVACNDDTSSGVQSRVRFDATGGVTYYFMVGSFFESPGGQLVFNVDVAPPPFEFGLSVNPVGSVKPSTGVVTIHGEIFCSRPAFAELFLQVDQKIGRVIVRGFGGTFFENCDGVVPWSVTVFGENGLFVGGKAQVSAFAFAFTEDGEEAFADRFLTVRLRGRSPNR
jgi:hypothetical protein